MNITKNQEIIARALEIAIQLTKKEDLSVRTDSDGKVFLNDKLFANMQTVIRIMNAKTFTNIINIAEKEVVWAFPNK